MNLAIWDIESSSASTDFGSIIEIGGILLDENFKEKDRFNLRCRLPEGEIFQASALLVNKTTIKQLTQVNLSHYQMLDEVAKDASTLFMDKEELMEEFMIAYQDSLIEIGLDNREIARMALAAMV